MRPNPLSRPQVPVELRRAILRPLPFLLLIVAVLGVSALVASDWGVALSFGLVSGYALSGST